MADWTTQVTGLDCPTNYIGYERRQVEASTCNTKWGQAQVRREQVIILSAGAISYIFYALSGSMLTVTTDRARFLSYILRCLWWLLLGDLPGPISDLNNNHVAGGTTLSIKDNNVKYKQTGRTSSGVWR